MSKSKIIQQLVDNEIVLSDALYKVLVITKELGNEEVLKWVKSELNGYDVDIELPDYRITSSLTINYSGINGSYKVNNVSLNPAYLKLDTLKKIKTVKSRESITSIENKLKEEGDVYHIDLSYLTNEVYENTTDGYHGVTCTSIWQVIPKQFFQEIYDNLKTKLIEILITLEYDLGVLDSKGIRYKKDKSKYKSLNSKIHHVIDNKILVLEKEENNILNKILIPIVVALFSGVILAYFLGWLGI